MSKKLNLRNLMALIAIPPILLLAFIAAFGLSTYFLGDPSVDELKSDTLTLGVVAIAGMLLSVGVLLAVGRRVLEPINEVSDAARELADIRLPKLIESLSNPGIAMPDFEPLEVSGQTELADLGEALNSLQNRAVTVANEQQRVVKEGISELVVNLARRNQSLLDRQIESIDSLESTEEDPDRLESLFRLDHLATRMRRNAESLLVLAGAEPSRRRGGPVVLADVIRVAMSEIEDYQHVTMGAIKTAHIGPQGAVDVAHLMSELLENATQFSPPDAPVMVTGDFDAGGYYEIIVQDRGIGMSAEQLQVANETIANPPELGLALTRSLGFQVIGRLAERLEVQVHLSHTEGGGTTASIKIPGGALSSGAAANVPAAFQSMPSSAPTISQPAVPHQNPLGAGPPIAQPAPVPQPIQSAPVAPAPEPEAPPAFASEQESPWADEPAPTAQQQAPVPQEFQQPAPAPQRQAPVPQAFQQPAPAPQRQAPVPQEIPQAFQQPTPQPIHEPPAQTWTPPPTPAPSQAPQPAPAPEPSPAVFEQPAEAWSPPAAPDHSEPPESMAQAMPSGPAFDQGVDALLDSPANRTDSGLVRRDRARNHAPASEGRTIPSAAAAPAAAASNRSPEEIRNMLARYRDGLKGRPETGDGPH
ncbi:MAG: HAMP domain-containing protein [Acidimicrobiales bacterium]|nr:HAMP domain-containing protein [Acidimicrobiales bacterium]